MKYLVKSSLLALTFAVSGAVNAGMVIFDGNNGGTAKPGSTETASGTAVGTDVQGDSLGFSVFDVYAGFSTETNLADSSFNRSVEINESSVAYQDLTPSHGGLGAFSGQADDTFKSDTDNLESNLLTQSTGDEVLFFNFDFSVILEKVWFNGDHTEMVANDEDGQVDASDSLFNIFYSRDGNYYQSVFGGSGQQAPIGREYLDTGVTEGFNYYAIAATGWNSAPGGYVEAINYTSVPEPGSLMLFGLGLAGLSLLRRRKNALAA